MCWQAVTAGTASIVASQAVPEWLSIRPPAGSWSWIRTRSQQENLAKRLGVPGEQLRPARESLIQNELITVFSPSEGQASGQLQLTPAGQQTLDKLAAAYHESLAELLDGWSPEQEAELATLLRRVATQLLNADTSTEFVSPSG